MLNYLKEHITEEIDGAMDYMAKAVENKGTSDGCIFKKMADMELEHANALTKMFEKQKKPSNITDADYGTAQKAVLDKYINSMSKIEAMKKLYYQV